MTFIFFSFRDEQGILHPLRPQLTVAIVIFRYLLKSEYLECFGENVFGDGKQGWGFATVLIFPK